MQITKSKFKIIVKTKSNSNKLVGFDKEKQAYLLNIKAVPEKGQANKEIIGFLSRLLKKQVRVVKGLRSKEKIIEVL